MSPTVFSATTRNWSPDAAETENVEQNAREKLLRKNLDLIVANDVAHAFGKDTNQVLVLGKDGARR